MGRPGAGGSAGLGSTELFISPGSLPKQFGVFGTIRLRHV